MTDTEIEVFEERYASKGADVESGSTSESTSQLVISQLVISQRAISQRAISQRVISQRVT